VSQMQVGFLSAQVLPSTLLTRNRRKLAIARFVVPHGPQKDAKAAVTSDCAHVFLNPLTWMRPSLFPNSPDASADLASEDAPLSGRLTCPNTSCGSNIGKFAWQGMQCSCGDWVVPAIALARARVDISEPVTTRRGPGNLAPGIRLPPSMRPSGVDTSTAGPFSERYTPVLINFNPKLC
jgi:dual specificity phosphatase 12